MHNCEKILSDKSRPAMKEIQNFNGWKGRVQMLAELISKTIMHLLHNIEKKFISNKSRQ